MATTVDYILKIQTSQSEKGLKSTAAQTDKLGKGFVAAAGQAAILAGGLKAVIDLGGMFIGFAIDATKAIIDFSQASADLINDINDLSNRSAVSAESIKALQFAFKASGQEAGAVTGILSRFPSILSQASEGVGRASDGFKRLGVSVKDSAGNLRDSDTILRETLAAIQKIPDQTTRAAVASDVFGRSAGQLLQALGQTGGLETFVDLTNEFGVNTGPKASAAAAEFQQAIAALETVTDGLKSQFIATFGPATIDLLKTFAQTIVFTQSIVKSFSSELSIGLEAAINTVISLFNMAINSVSFFGRALVQSIPIFGNVALLFYDMLKPLGLIDKAFAAIAGDSLRVFEAKLQQARKQSAVFASDLEKLIKAGGAGGGGAGGGGGGGAVASTAAGPNFSGFVQGLKNLDDQFEKTGFELQGAMFKVYTALEGLPALMEKAFKISIAGIITDSILQAVSGPSGFLNLLGDSLSGVTMGLSKVITGAITGLAALGEKSPEEIRKQFEDFPKNIEKGLEVLPRIIIQVLPKFIAALAIGIAKGLLKLPFIIVDALLEAFKQAFEAIKEFFKSIFTKEGRAERRRARRNRRREGEGLGFFRELFGTESGFMGGGRMVSGQGGLRFTQSRGLAMLHEGETIVPASGQGGQATRRMMSGARGPNINININSAVVENRAIDELVRKLESRFSQFGVGKSTLFGR